MPPSRVTSTSCLSPNAHPVLAIQRPGGKSSGQAGDAVTIVPWIFEQLPFDSSLPSST